MKKIKGFFTILGVIFFVMVVLSFMKKFLSSDFPTRESIGIVKVEGAINNSSKYLKLLEKLEKNKSIKAIVLRVNSPGGVVGACQEIHDKVREISKKKPIVVSMGSVAASGGLYISLPATKIVANPGTITGSIGVIIQSFNFKALAEKIGIKVVTVKSGKFKDLLNPFKDVNEESLKILQSLIDDSYDQFVEAVSKDRNIPIEKVKSFADGRVFTGRQAKALGLVDELGNIDKAIEIAKKLSNSPNAKVFEIKEKKDFLGRILEGEVLSPVKELLNVLTKEPESMKLMYLLI
ncbi:MAG: signal peptide peptidase SppA [Desulfurobacteriaceae bacterium]